MALASSSVQSGKLLWLITTDEIEGRLSISHLLEVDS